VKDEGVKRTYENTSKLSQISSYNSLPANTCKVSNSYHHSSAITYLFHHPRNIRSSHQPTYQPSVRPRDMTYQPSPAARQTQPTLSLTSPTQPSTLHASPPPQLTTYYITKSHYTPATLPLSLLSPHPSTQPAMPPAYLISYSRDLIRQHDARAARQLHDALPPQAYLLATLHCYAWTPPPVDMCELYSGVSRIVQESVLRDARARQGM
jgi:hypothetical protein